MVMDYYKFVSASVAVALAVGGVTVLAPPASGKTGPVVVTAKVDVVVRRIGYLDLNLTSEPGQLTLSRRVGGAIGSLCTEATGGYDGNFHTGIASRKCHTSAWNQARPQMARAVQRANEIASTGSSTIAAAGISIVLSK
jgi:UrcA family protein